jgi:hypothetical protein
MDRGAGRFDGIRTRTVRTSCPTLVARLDWSTGKLIGC